MARHPEKTKGSYSNRAVLAGMVRTAEGWSDRLLEMEGMEDMAALTLSLAEQLKDRIKFFRKKKSPMLGEIPRPESTIEELLDASRIYHPQSREKLTVLLEQICIEFHMTYKTFRRVFRSSAVMQIKRVMTALLIEMGLTPKQISILANTSMTAAYRLIKDYEDKDSDYKKDYIYFTNKYRSFYEDE